MIINVTLCIFSLLPVAPLDGEKVLEFLLPEPARNVLYALRRTGCTCCWRWFFILLSWGWTCLGLWCARVLAISAFAGSVAGDIATVTWWNALTGGRTTPADAEWRVRQHNAGKGARYTRLNGPVKLVPVEAWCGQGLRAQASWQSSALGHNGKSWWTGRKATWQRFGKLSGRQRRQSRGNRARKQWERRGLDSKAVRSGAFGKSLQKWAGDARMKKIRH